MYEFFSHSTHQSPARLPSPWPLLAAAPRKWGQFVAVSNWSRMIRPRTPWCSLMKMICAEYDMRKGLMPCLNQHLVQISFPCTFNYPRSHWFPIKRLIHVVCNKLTLYSRQNKVFIGCWFYFFFYCTNELYAITQRKLI